jgi:CDP-diglyceride synthetase
MHAFIWSSKELVNWEKLFLQCVSCQDNGHFLLMWHHHTYLEHSVHDHGWGRFCHLEFVSMIGSWEASSFASGRFPFAPWPLITFLCSSLLSMVLYYQYSTCINIMNAKIFNVKYNGVGIFWVHLVLLRLKNYVIGSFKRFNNEVQHTIIFTSLRCPP